MDFTLLCKLGLSMREAKIYLKLLELETSEVSKVAKALNENRTSSYSLLLSMEKRGFVSFVKKNGIKYYHATNPEVLVERYLDNARGLKALLPQLLAIKSHADNQPKISFYEGVEGIKQISEILNETPNSTLYTFLGLDEETMHPELKRYWEEEFIDRRINLNIHLKTIVTRDIPFAKGHPHTQEGQKRETRRVNSAFFPIKAQVEICPNNKVALYSYAKNELMGVVIEHEAFHTTLKTAFDLAWIAAGSKEDKKK